MGFDDDDFFGGGNDGFGNQDAFGYNDNPDAFGYNDGGMQQQQQSYEQQQPRAAPRERPARQRRASVGVTAGPMMSMNNPTVAKPMRTKSSDTMMTGGGTQQPTRAGGRRQPSSSTAMSGDNRGMHVDSLNGRLESVSGKVGNRTGNGMSGDRSVASNNSATRRPGGSRRASLAAGASSYSTRSAAMPARQHRSNNDEVDFGYGVDDHHHDPHNNYNHNNTNRNNNNDYEVEDMGYGDEADEMQYEQPVVVLEEPVRARRQRRCSIADVVNTASIQPSASSTVDYGYGESDDCPAPASRGLPSSSTSQRLGGASHNASISNMAIPMTLSEEPKRTNRRGSIAMLGNIGRSSKSKEPEPTTAKKPAADRDRQRQRQGGTLLDRVGAGAGKEDGRGTMRSGTTSYSDRIMSK